MDFSQVKKWLIGGAEVKKVVRVLDSTVLWQAIQRVLKEWRGLSPLTCTPTVANPFENVRVYGDSVQDGTPTPTTPIEIKSVGDKQVLPYGYAQLEYIESTGTQYIDTDIYGELESELKFVGQVTQYYAGGNYGHLWGDLSDSTKAITLSTPTRSTFDATSRFGNMSAKITASPVKILPLNETVTIIENKEKVTSSNGIELIFNATDEFTTNKTLILFGAEEASGVALARHNFKCFYFSHKKNGVLVQELIPARRNSDNKVGMYDTVNNQFLTNAGTGEFVAGDVIGQGGYKVPVKVSGKNLFNENDEGIVYRININASGTETSSSISSSTYYIKVEPSTDYTVGFTSIFSGSVTRYHLYDENKTWLQQVKTNTSGASGSIETVKFTTTSDTQYLRFTMRGTSASEIENGKIQLEQGDTATDYQPYIEPTTTNIYINEPLRKVGEYSDTLTVEGTNVTVVRNIGENLVAGADISTLYSGTYATRVSIGKVASITKPETETAYSSNSFILARAGLTNGKPNTITLYSETEPRCFIWFENDVVPDLATAKRYIDTLNIIIYNVLATPTTETFTIDTPINAFDDISVIAVDTTTKPSEIYASEYIEE